jgi:DNA-binding NtrC family response regulator
MVYTVDDEKDLTELYTALLTGAGYTVRAFNHRAEALAALQADRKKPDLLITDYVGSSMRIEMFVSACRAVYPTLRILMATGLHESHAGVLMVKPHEFIRKPFTPDEFLQTVRSALVGPAN